MDIRNKFMFRALLGFTLGLLVGMTTYILFTPAGAVIDKPYMTLHFIGSALMGLVGYGGAIVYDIEEWSLGKATFSHYLVTFITMLVISELLGWFAHDVLLVVFVMFTATYALIWLTEYLIWKKQIRDMNRDLETMRGNDQE